MKTRILVLLAILIIIAVIPIFPVSPANPEWSESEFETRKIELERATEKINLWTWELRDHPNYKKVETYNVACRIGKGTIYKSLLGFELGSHYSSTYAFGTWVIPTVPHLEYSTDSTAFLDPEDFEAFVTWVNKKNNYESLPEQLQKKPGK